MNQTKSIGYNYIMNMIGQGTVYLLPFIVNPYVSNILGPEGMGKVSFVTAVLSYFTMFALLGAPTYGIREVSKIKDNRKMLSKTVYEIFALNIFSGIIVYIFFFVYIMIFKQMSEYKIMMTAMCPMIALNIIGLEWMYKGLEKFSTIAVRNCVTKFIIIIIIFMCVKSNEDIVLYGVLTIFATYGVSIWNFCGKNKYVRLKEVNKLDLKRHMIPLLIFFSMTVATTIYTNLDMVMLGIMRNDYEAGIYDAAAKIKIVAVAAASSLGAVLLPRVTSLVNEGDLAGFRRLSGKALSLIAIFSASLAVYMGVTADNLIGLFSGDSFGKSVVVLRILAPTVTLIGLTNIIGIQMLIPLGKEKMVLLSEIAGAVVDLIINLLLIPQYGASGAAIGTLAAEVVVLLVQIIASREYVIEILFKIQYFKISIACVAAASFIIVIGKLIDGKILFLFCSAAIFYMIFGLTLMLLKENECMWMIEKVKRRNVN